jgi:lactoylglutathione lyase
MGDPMSPAKKARAINHVALEVGDIDEALAFYGRLFEFELRSRSKSSAFIDLGDRFLALQKGRTQPADDGRHFGLVVDDKEAVRRTLADAGVGTLPGQFLDFLDPWGNCVKTSATTTSSSLRRRTSCAPWGCRIFPRTRTQRRSLPTRGCASVQPILVKERPLMQPRIFTIAAVARFPDKFG